MSENIINIINHGKFSFFVQKCYNFSTPEYVKGLKICEVYHQMYSDFFISFTCSGSNALVPLRTVLKFDHFQSKVQC